MLKYGRIVYAGLTTGAHRQKEKLSHVCRLPFYLDNIGTILTALVGGYLPCIAVGFFYNIIVGIGDNMTTY